MKLDEIIEKVEEIRSYLPNIRPLQEFLHLNMLPGLQKKNFWCSMRSSSEMYSFIPFLDFSFYQDKYKKGLVDQNILEREILQNYPSTELSSILLKLNRDLKDFHFPEKSYRPIHKLINQLLTESITELTEPVLIRFLSSFYDQGFSFWQLPNSNLSLYECFYLLIDESFVDLRPVNRIVISKLKDKSSIEVVKYILDEIFEDDELKKLYIEESILSLKGWAGMIHTIEMNPELVLEEKNGSLIDYLAIRLVIDFSWIVKLNKLSMFPLKRSKLASDFLTKKSLLSDEEWSLYKIWQQAYEKTYHLKTLQNLSSYNGKKSDKEFLIQAFFCIDDRECSVRRHIENIDDNIETFGTPGHFGLDFYYKESAMAYPKKHCPAPVDAKFILMPKENKKLLKRKVYHWHYNNFQNLIWEVLSIFFHGIFYGFKLLGQVFFPTKDVDIIAVESKINPNPLLVLNENEIFENGKRVGFDKKSAATKIASVIKSIGMKSFAKVVFMIGHGSVTTNNPYFSAYGCGACSGRDGNINAMVFCELANDYDVREELKKEFNICIPSTTIFVAGFHDTCSDKITLYDIDKLSDEYSELIERFKRVATNALKENALVRCKDFALVPKDITADEALIYTHKRSLSIFEPRPELGHTRNCLCIIGPRSSSRSFNFERRAFLQSYDPLDDLSGDQLNGILSAAIPVCGGINLDYFYSKSNNRGIGAASKLSHNIVGLMGLANGTEDDLLTGLAYQMTELHEPLRIMFVIEQKLDIVKKVISTNQNLWDWVSNEWVLISVIDPITKQTFYFMNGEYRILGEVLA